MRKNVTLQVKLLSPDATVPFYATPDSSGFDLKAIQQYVLEPGETKLIKTGLAFGIPDGHEIQVRPRSGVSLKTGLRICNAPGSVDKDFVGEVCVIMQNTSSGLAVIEKGERIAQAVLAEVPKASFQIVDQLDSTTRGEGAFGHTGSF